MTTTTADTAFAVAGTTKPRAVTRFVTATVRQTHTIHYDIATTAAAAAAEAVENGRHSMVC